MNKKVKKVLLLGLTAVMALSVFAGCKKEATNSFEGKRTRVVIGSTSTTGDSYMIADATMRYLAKELGADMKVDAVGAGPAFEAMINEKPDGNTIMMFHDMTYLGISFGAFEDRYALENMTVGPRVGQNPGSLFAARKDAPYEDMKEMAEWLAANPSEVARLAVEAGGVSHIAFISYYEWVVETFGQDVADRVQVVVGGSTAEKSQMLWDGNADVIFADYSSLLQYTEEGVDGQLAMKFVGVLDKIDGDDSPTYKDMGITLNGDPFVFSKDFLIYLPKDMDPAFLAELDKAVEAVTKNPDFIKDMENLKYKPAFLPSKEAETFIKAKRDSLDGLIQEAPPLDDLTVR